MAKKKSSAVQLLTVSLIIFVMLTFVLAVTSYVFYAQVADAEAAAKAADVKLNGDNIAVPPIEGANDRIKVLEEEKRTLINDLIGAEPGSTVDLIDDELATWGDRAKQVDGAGNTTPSYRSLVQTYENALQKANKDNDSLVEENNGLKENLKKVQSDHSEARDDHQAELKKVQEELAETEKKRQAASEKFDEDTAEMMQQLDAANDRAERLQAFEEALRIALSKKKEGKDEESLGEFLLSDERLQAFEATDDAIHHVNIILEELKEKTQEIKQKNRLLGQLRIANPSIQQMIFDAVPPYDRIDGIDGYIVAVNESNRFVDIQLPRTGDIPIGLLFFVYTPEEKRPLFAAYKGIVEIVSKPSNKLVRGRMLNRFLSDPIVPGDAVATSLWSPFMPLEVVIVGNVQIYRDSATDTDQLKALTQRFGKVTKEVTRSTSFVVDAGIPRSNGDKLPAEWDAEKDRRETALEDAKKLGIQVLRVDRFLELFGLEENYFDADHLVTPTP